MDRRRVLLVLAAALAAVGVGLVFLFARGADSRAADRFDTTEVLTVAKNQTISPGESIELAISENKLSNADVAIEQVLQGAITQDDLDDLAGQVALTTLYPGEQIIRDKFGGVGDPIDDNGLPVPAGKIAKPETFDLPAGSFVRPGTQLAVFLTADASTSTCLLIPQVTVIAVGGTTSSDDSEGEGGSSALHLAVTQDQFEWIEDAKRRGELSVAITNGSSDLETAGGGPCEQIRGGQ